MKIKWGALVVDGRGKLGGHVAAQNRGGSYLRTKVTPSNPQTTYQTGVRQIFATISAAWSGLTAAQIVAWNEAVDAWKRTNIFGDLKQPSGKNLHQRLNLERLSVGYPALLADPPAKLSFTENLVTAVTIAIGAATITLTGATTEGTETLSIFSSGVVSNGTTFVKNLMRKIDAYSADSPVPADLYAAYVAKFGAPVVGDKIYVGVKSVLESGQASPLQTVLATVTA